AGGSCGRQAQHSVRPHAQRLRPCGRPHARGGNRKLPAGRWLGRRTRGAQALYGRAGAAAASMTIAAALLALSLAAAGAAPDTAPAAKPSVARPGAIKGTFAPTPNLLFVDPKPTGGQKPVWDVAKVAPDAADGP